VARVRAAGHTYRSIHRGISACIGRRPNNQFAIAPSREDRFSVKASLLPLEAPLARRQLSARRDARGASIKLIKRADATSESILRAAEIAIDLSPPRTRGSFSLLSIDPTREREREKKEEDGCGTCTRTRSTLATLGLVLRLLLLLLLPPLSLSLSYSLILYTSFLTLTPNAVEDVKV